MLVVSVHRAVIFPGMGTGGTTGKAGATKVSTRKGVRDMLEKWILMLDYRLE